MSGSLPDVLLRIAAAVAADGGAGVRAAIETALIEAAPFDACEISFATAEGEPRPFPLRGALGPLLGRDLLDHVLAYGAPYRIDDWPDAEAFPETLRRLVSGGLRSALALPFRFAEAGTPPVSGAVSLARFHGWAFVGASLPRLVPLASMAGLALDRALRLSALAERAPAPEDALATHAAPAAPTREPEAEPAESDAVRELRGRAEGAENRVLEAERVRDDWAGQADALSKRVEELEARLQEAERMRDDWAGQAEVLRRRVEETEPRLQEAERVRDDWAGQAEALRKRVEEQEAEIERLKSAKLSERGRPR